MEKLSLYLQYPFVRYALIVGVLIALSASLLGVPLVLKRYSLIGDALSHVAFGATALASILRLVTDLPLVLFITVLFALLLLKRGEKNRGRGDAVLAMISVGSLALGYLVVNLFSASANLSGDVCSTLFGSTSILTLTPREVLLSLLLSLVVVLVFVLFYHKLFAITFDEDFSRAVGTDCDRYNLLLALVTSCVIVLAMNLVGSLLISALIVFPALSAMRLFYSFRSVILFSALFSVLAALAGILLSILAGTPVGSTIVAMDLLGFGLSCLLARLRGSG